VASLTQLGLCIGIALVIGMSFAKLCKYDRVGAFIWTHTLSRILKPQTLMLELFRNRKLRRFDGERNAAACELPSQHPG
jgi:hypothetical protein